MIRKKRPPTEIIIDLTGPDGNAFALIGYAEDLARLLELDGTTIIKEMMGGDYEHLIQIFENNFGEYVILER
jgi:hypothetical protein